MRRPLFHAAAWYCGGVVLGEFQPAAPLLLLTFAAATGLAVLAFIWINHVADVADLGELGQESLVHRIDNLTADLVITSYPNFGEPLQPWLLDAIQPKVILVHDSQFPVDERTTKSFRTRMSRAGAKVFYTTRKGGMRVEIKPGKWRIIDAAGRTLWLDGSL